jgi:site-specific recombinase XerD
LGCGWRICGVAERRVFIAEGKGGHQRLLPVSRRFFDHVAAYLECERPAGAATAVAGGPSWTAHATGDQGDPGASAGHTADVLRPHRRVGLGRGAGTGADVPGDLPRQDHPLPKALDAAAAKLLRAAQNDRRPLVRVSVEVLLRTGLRVSEYTGLRSDAVVQIGAAPWLHVPVGKLREDRYLPLHPNLVALIDDYRARFVPPEHPLLLPPPNGTAPDRHTVTRMINRAGKVAGLPHIHPHQLRHTLATQASNRGMSLEAITAMLGHRSMDMTLRYAKIANRTVGDEYLAVTDKVEALYGQPPQLPADTIGPTMARLRREHHRLLGNGYYTRPAEGDCAFESICQNCTFFQTSIQFRPTLRAQHDHAASHGQQQRADLFQRLPSDLNDQAS